MPAPPPDNRIHSLTTEIDRLRNSHDQADTQLHALILKITEIQLNLATQDRTLNKLETAIHGNGKPGLITRIDRLEQLTATLLKAGWLLTAAATTATVKWIVEHIR